MKQIVLLHEIGHGTLYCKEATKVEGFQAFEIFYMQDNRMDYEANIFASLTILLPNTFRAADSNILHI